jgi:hypothetical protein
MDGIDATTAYAVVREVPQVKLPQVLKLFEGISAGTGYPGHGRKRLGQAFNPLLGLIVGLFQIHPSRERTAKEIVAIAAPQFSGGFLKVSPVMPYAANVVREVRMHKGVAGKGPFEVAQLAR